MTSRQELCCGACVAHPTCGAAAYHTSGECVLRAQVCGHACFVHCLWSGGDTARAVIASGMVSAKMLCMVHSCQPFLMFACNLLNVLRYDLRRRLFDSIVVEWCSYLNQHRTQCFCWLCVWIRDFTLDTFQLGDSHCAAGTFGKFPHHSSARALRQSLTF